MKSKKEKKENHQWQTEDWGDCSVSCGGGQRNRKTFCAGKDKKQVDDSLCEGITGFIIILRYQDRYFR